MTQPHATEPRPLQIESATEAIRVDRYALPEQSLTRDALLERAPFGSAWFVAGDGGWAPAPLLIEVRVEGVTLEDSISQFTRLVRVASAAERVRWGSLTRAVQGVERVTRSVTVIGFRVELAFLPLGAAWVSDAGEEVFL